VSKFRGMTTLFLPPWLRAFLHRRFGWLMRKVFTGSACPACGSELPPPNISPEYLWDTRIDCPACGRWSSLIATGPVPGAVSTAPAVEFAGETGEAPAPSGCRVEVVDRAGTRMWKVPATGGFHPLLVFGVIWLAFSLIIMGVMLAGAMKSEEGLLVPAAMMALFVLAGLAMVWFGVKISLTEHWLLVNERQFVHESRFLRRARRAALAREGVNGVALREAYRQNERPVMAIEVGGREGKVRFGTALKQDEKEWLLEDLRRSLSRPGAAGDGGAGSTGTVNVPPDGEFEAGGLRVSATGNECVIQLPDGKLGGTLVAIGGFSFVISCVMLALGPRVFDGDAPVVFQFFSVVFALFWYVPLGLFAVGALLAVATGWRWLGLKRTLKVNRHGARLDWELGAARGEWIWTPAQIDGIEVRSLARPRHANDGGKPGCRVEIALPGFVGAIGHSDDTRDLAPVARAMNIALGRAQREVSD
jgi:hypothetical protein